MGWNRKKITVSTLLVPVIVHDVFIYSVSSHICLSSHFFMNPSIYPFIHVSVHLSKCPLHHPSICPFIPTILYMVSSNRKTGVLALGKANDSSIDLYHSSLDFNGVPHKVLTGREAKRLYPRQLSIPDDDQCIFEPNGGILKASKALRILQVLMHWELKKEIYTYFIS